MKKASNKKKIVIANWKSQPSDINDALKNLELIKKIKIDSKKILPILCPPAIYLEAFNKKYKGTVYKFGSQNISINNDSETTGEINPQMLKNLRVQYSIIGHSDRRILGEDNTIISQKVSNALKNKIIPIVCLGEEKRDRQGEYLRFLENQIKEIFHNIEAKDFQKVVIAYEPVWAIGKNIDVIDTHQLNQTILFIRKILVGIYDRKLGMSVKILYGGSVNLENVKALNTESDIDGFLIGRASTNPHVLKDILKILQEKPEKVKK